MGTGKPHQAGFRGLIRAYGLLSRIMGPYFAAYGLTGAQWGVLRTLHRGEREGLGGLRLTDLGERLIVRPPSVTALVDRLERTRLLERVTSQEDRRVKLVSLTQSGRALVERVLEGHDTQIARVMGGLKTGEQRQLSQLLQALLRHLESVAEDPTAGPSAVPGIDHRGEP